VLLVACRDAREMKRDEQLRAERLKTESLGVLAAGVAHDFNNLLEVVLGRVDLALRRLPAESPARASLEQAEAAVHRAAELAGKMLTYSGSRLFDLRRLDLSAVLRDDRPLCEAGVPANVRVTWELGASLPPVMADPGAIRQALRQLILNAAEAIGDLPGSVRLTTRLGELAGGAEEQGRRYLPAGPLAPGPFVLCEVRDDGPGMDEETRSRAFDPFFSTKFTGRGLGLPTVLGIMHGHRGGLAVETAPGEGTTVILALPLAAGPPTVAAPPRPRPRGATVLVVDDDDLVRDLLSDFLTEAGLAVVVARSGAEAVELYAARRDEFGLVLLDLTMPGMGGEETLRRLRAIEPGLRIVLCSGYSREEATRGFEDLNLAGFLQKPCDPALLLEVVREQLGRSPSG
jgi:nitrogen-specific signal transduction histidine kinase